MKHLKSAISFLLAALLLFTAAPLQSIPVLAGSGSAVSFDAQNIAAGETLTAEVSEGGIVYFRFVPETDGVYSFTSDADDDTYGYLYDADMNVLAEDDDSGEKSMQFLITRRFTAGVTYYFAVRFLSDDISGSIPVMLYENDTWCGAGYGVTVAPESKVTLFADAWSRIGEISYQWMNGENAELEGETGPNLTVGPVTENAYYSCMVTFPPADEESEPVSEVLYFDISLDNELTADAKDYQYSFRVAPGGSATMEVEASCAVGKPVYQWYDEDGLAMEGETGASCTVTQVMGPAQYRCDVTDAYHTDSRSVYFDVAVDVGLSASAVGETYRNVYHDEAAALAVDVSIAEGYAYHCQWYINGEEQEGETGLSFTVPPLSEQWTDVRCVVTDDYGNEFTVAFYLTLTNDFYARAKDGRNTVYVLARQPATLTVEAGCHAGVITYQWQVLNTETGDYEPIEDADGTAEYVTPAVTSEADYRCVVSDPYEDIAVDFTVIPVTATPITLGEETEAQLNGQNDPVYFSFTPETTGEYRFSSIEKEVRASTTLYDADFNELGWAYSYGENGFLLTARLTAGETYYFSVYTSGWDDAGAVTLLLKLHDENGFYAVAAGNEDYITVKAGTAAVLAVEANANQGDLHYQWYNGDTDEALEGETGAALTVVPEKSIAHYYCSVWDDYENEETVWFQVDLDNELRAEAKTGDYIAVPYGETTVLEVEASALMPGFTYQWCDINFNEIEDETSASYTVPAVTAYTRYYCRVTDRYGSYTHVAFVVTVDNDFSVSPVGDTNLSVVFGEDVTLQVQVTAANDEGLSIVWRDNDDNVIPGETGTSLTVPQVTAYSCYTCEVTDAYDNYGAVTFNISVDTGLTVHARDGKTDFTVSPGESVELAVEASAYDGVALTYTWYDDNWNPIENETGYTFTVDNVQRSARYICEVRDDYGNSIDVDFYIYIDTGLTARARNNQTDFTVAPGEDVVLAVEATANEGVAFTYTWYDDNWNPIENETGYTFTVDNVQRSARYICKVRDDYGNSIDVDFYIYIDTGLTVRARNGQTEFTVTPGESLELAVEATVNGDIALTYTWYDDNWNAIENETSNVLNVTDINRYARYICRVRDAFGNERDVFFHIYIDTGLTVRARNGQTEFTVTPGESVELAVEATVNGEVALTYTWYDENWNPIENETGDTFTVNDVQRSTRYICEVRDSYGNYRNVEFYIRIDTGLTARARNGKTEFTVNPGDSLELAVEAAVNGEVALTYTWYDDNWNPIENETSNVLNLTDINRYARYICEVRDDYGNSIEVEFYIHINTGLTARARNGQTEFTVAPGESVELAVEAAVNGEVALTYTWYDEHWKPIKNETSNELTVNGVEKYTEYTCRVQDAYGNRIDVFFYIYIDTGLTARALNNKTDFSVAPGNDLTLTVVASANNGVTLTYEWHYSRMTYVDGNGLHWVSETVQGATGPTLQITGVDGRRDYTCCVYDNYGGSRSVSFIVTVANGFTADAEKTDFLVPRGGSATLRVNAECTEGALTYVWSSNGTVLEEDGAALTLTGITESAVYSCTVTDDFGNYTWINFRVICADAVPLVLRGENIAAIGNENDTVIFSFTPEENGEYLIWTETDRDTYVTLYDADFNQLAKNDDGGDNNNFRLSYMLTAGKTYYYAVRYYDEGVGSFNVFFTLRLPNGFSAYAKNDEYSFDVPYGETTALQVAAHADNGELHYKWTNGRNEILPSETDTLVTAPVTERTTYTCVVTDDYGNRESIMFTVSVDNRFTAHAVGEETQIYVMPGETAALAVEASAANGALTYQWFDDYHNLIENADTASYAFVPEKNRVELFCRVTDMYGNMKDVWFTVILDNGFSVRAKDDVTDLYVPLGETALLETEVSYIEGEVTYQWYAFETREDDDGYSYNEQVPLAGCTSRAFRTPEVRDYREYMCRVRDEYGNTGSVYFNVCPEGGMRVEAENFAVVLVPYGETATLTAPAEADVPLTWEWTRYDYGENGGPTVLPETGASLETTPVTYRQNYVCEVSDVYGQRYFFHFTVLVDTGIDFYGSREVELYAAPGGSVTLDPGITPVNGAVLTCVWYNESEKLPFTGSAYTVENVTGNVYYYCSVTDEYGGWMEIYFRVIVPTEPTYRWNDDKTVTAAFCTDGGELITETVPVTERVTPAACTVRGSVVYTAVFTNPVFEEQTITQTIPALGHLWSDWADTAAATCTAPGTQAKSCARCSAEKTRETEALGHVWSEPAYEWAADHSAVTATRVCMNDPSHVETETVSATAETSQSDCVSGGVTTYTSAPFTNPAFEVQVLTVELGDASHDWAEPTYEWAADHSAVTATRVCQRDASHVETETVPATYTETKAAACTEKGEGKYVSAAFENPAFTAQTAVVELAALGHDFSAKTVDARYLKSEATCTEAAVYYKSCTRCGTASDTAVFVSGNSLGHDFSVEKAEERYLKSAATCTEPAVYYMSCSRCGAAGSATFVSGEALGHSFGDWTVTTAPTCTEKGEETRECARCHTKETRDVDALGHTFGEWAQTTDPTCTEKGVETRECARCHTKETRDVEALGHNFGEWAQTTAPTCTEKGVETRECARCHAKETRDVEALGHNFGDWTVTTAPTCTEKGEETRECSRCHAKETRDVDALGHNFGDWAVTTAPTCTEKGEETRECSRCHTKETRDVNAKGHTEETMPAVAPTCTETGLTAGVKCSVCGAILTAQTTVDALGHSFGAWTKYTAAEHRRVCKNDASHTQTAAHTWDNGKVTKPATVTQSGEKTYTCTACGETKTEEIGKLPDPPVTVTDPASGVSVTYDSKAYSDKITVKVVDVATPENDMPAVYEKTFAVDISTFIGSKEVEPKAPVTVTIPVPAGFNAKTLALYHVKDDGSVEKVAFTVKDGKLAFTAFAFSVYVVADTSTEVKQPEFLRGDVDGDGKVGTGDARLALRKAIGLETYASESREFLAADVDGSGEVTTADARYILRHAIGLPNPEIGW